MDSIIFEEMNEKYLDAVTQIYNYYVSNTTVSFHAHEITTEEMKEIVFFENAIYKTFSIKDGEILCGYVLFTQFKKREAYNKTAEVTIYLSPVYLGKGIGTKALQYIEEYAVKQGIHALIAIICGENTASIKLFEKNGYIKCAHFKEVGQKFGRMLDIVDYEKIL